ncbi:response regulator [Halocola ammonii]
MKKVILVVEDDRYVRENTIEMLEISGYEVLSAENGSLGYEVAMLRKPDLILCDITMPETNGIIMLEKLRDNRATSEIPVVFFSAHSSIQSAMNDEIASAVSYLRKPFTHEELMEVIEGGLGGDLQEFQN